MKNRWNCLKKIKKEDYLVLLLVGVLLLIIALPTKKQKAGETFLDANDSADVMELVSGESYGEYWEKRLEQILPAMEGVGRVRVLLSLEDEGELFVEKDTPVSRSMTREQDSDGGTREVTEYSGTENTLMVTQKDGKQTPYVVRESKPKVTGILVLAQGGDNERIRKEITCLLQALFDIEAHKIVVAKMKTG